MPPTAPPSDPYRLPTNTVPRRYDVRLRPSLDDATFEGSVSIEVDVQRETDRMVLNAAELTITSCTVGGRDASWDLDPATERMIVTSSSSVRPGRTTLEIGFHGVLNDLLRGFYRSTYTDDDGVEHVIATTQMQATDCRRAFPCWDEPALKAVFGITLDVEDGLTAISNGPEVERTAEGGRTVIRFADTMSMSTYLVAFVVGRLEATEPIEVDGIPLRVVHVPGKGDLTGVGLDVGSFALRWFQDYYGIPYPGEKVDLVALPDFAAGAMENLGCITFRESVLLVDPRRSTQQEHERVADVVCHELAHMWFGDLVTMRWWNGIWLNEAFATFMEIAACDAYRADWERWTSFGLERSAAFETDSLRSTRPVEYEVRSPADCEGMFDVLTYQKGGSLLRMLEQFLGAARFRRGVGHYLRRHAYGNTETNDLWDAIEETGDEPVRKMMDSWIWQPGFPLVEASIADGGRRLQLAQRRFLFADPEGDASDEATWVVPVHVRIGKTTSTYLLDDDGAPITVDLDDPAAHVVVNAGGHGFYRVAYDQELRARLAGDALARLSTLERYSLVDDAWSATIAGRLAAGDLLDFLDGFSDERQHTVWQAMVIAWRGVGRLVEGDALDAFRARVRTAVAPALAALGDRTPEEDDLVAKLRGLLTSTLGVLGGDEATRRRCREIYEASAGDHSASDPELLAAATTVIAAAGGTDTYDRLLEGYRTAATPQDQLRHLYALAEFDDHQLIMRTCDLALGEVKTQNAPFLLRAAIANRSQGAAAWTFVREHWSEANQRFPSNTIVRMIDSVKLLNTPDLVSDVQSFFADHPIEQSLKTQQQILERQRVNAALRAREEGPLTDALLAD